MTMIACYDLSRCPPTYDVVAFLAHAELERLRRKEDWIELHVLPGPEGGFRRDSLWPRTVGEREKLRDRVLVPLCNLLPSVREVSVDRTRAAEGWGKGEYRISLPAILSALREGARPLRGPRSRRDGRLVTFTLREAEHHPRRNSRSDQWFAAAGDLEALGYRVVVVRDTARAGEVVAGVRQDHVAPHSISHRAALYSQAALNVGICNGPMWMAVFMDAPVLMLRPTTNEALGCYDDAFYAKHGLPRGGQLPCSPPHQRLVWEEDMRDNIVRAVREMVP